MDLNHIDKSDMNLIELNPEKSLHLRGNITVTPISVPKRTSITILPTQEIEASRSPMMPFNPLDIGRSSMKRGSIDSMNDSLMIKNIFNQNEVICFEGNKLNEETTIVAVKSDVVPAKKVTNSLGFTSISSVQTVPSIIMPCAQPNTNNVTKVIKKPMKIQQGQKVTSGSPGTNDLKPAHYKPIAPRLEEKISQQTIKSSKSTPPTKNVVSNKPRQEKLSGNVVISPKNTFQMGDKFRNIQGTKQKSGSQIQVKTKAVSTLSKMTTISPIGGPTHKSNNLTGIISKPQAPLKMSVTNGLLGTLKANMDISVELKSTTNKHPMKRVSSDVPIIAPKPKYILPFKMAAVSNRVIASSVNSLVNGKSVGLKPSTNGLKPRHPGKFGKVKGNHITKQLPSATNVSNNTSQFDKHQNSPGINERPTVKSSAKGPNGASSNKILLKKKPGRPAQSLNFTGESTLDTELSFNQKQNVAHEILTQLLIVTSQLPMVKFSHALETIETLSDAFKFGHRVNMSLDRHEETNINDVEAFDVCYESDLERGPSASLSDTQVDGQLDADALYKLFQCRAALLPDMAVDADDADQAMEPLNLLAAAVQMQPLPLPAPQPIEADDEPMEVAPSRKRTNSDEFPPLSPDSKKPKTA